jgi:hypothetical protein
MVNEYKQNFGCSAGSLPFKCLGIPIHNRKLLNKNGNPPRIASKESWIVG